MKNILRENMRRFGTKNLLTEQQSMAEPFRGAVERYRDAIITILNFSVQQIGKDPRTVRSFDTFKIELNKAFTKALDNFDLGQVYSNYGPNFFISLKQQMKFANQLGQDGNKKFAVVVNAIEKSGSALIKHIMDTEEGLGSKTVQLGKPDQDTINDLSSDQNKIAALDNSIKMMNQVLPTIMVKR